MGPNDEPTDRDLEEARLAHVERARQRLLLAAELTADALGDADSHTLDDPERPALRERWGISYNDPAQIVAMTDPRDWTL